jgi:hypothetical protein
MTTNVSAGSAMPLPRHNGGRVNAALSGREVGALSLVTAFLINGSAIRIGAKVLKIKTRRLVRSTVRGGRRAELATKNG